jgi:hypothetical protein
MRKNILMASALIGLAALGLVNIPVNAQSTPPEVGWSPGASCPVNQALSYINNQLVCIDQIARAKQADQAANATHAQNAVQAQSAVTATTATTATKATQLDPNSTVDLSKITGGNCPAGQFLTVTKNKLTCVTIPSSGGGSANFTTYKAFTSSGTWTVPAGVTKVRFYGIGGGGGSQKGYNVAHTGGGGGYCVKTLTVSPGQVLSVTVGGGGKKGSTSSSAAGTGGTTSLSGGCSATGGKGGSWDKPGSGGSASGGDLNQAGSAGNSSSTPSTVQGGIAGGNYSPIGGSVNSTYGRGGTMTIYMSCYSAGEADACEVTGETVNGTQGIAWIEW